MEARAIVRQAMAILTPAVPARMEDGHQMLTHWTRKIIVEEGHTVPQLVHILHLIVQHFRVSRFKKTKRKKKHTHKCNLGSSRLPYVRPPLPKVLRTHDILLGWMEHCLLSFKLPMTDLLDHLIIAKVIFF